MVKENLVSVVIPSYNRFNFLVNAIKSVENQTYKNIEIIIINDGSSQREYFENSFGKNIKIIHMDQNQKQYRGFPSDSIRNIGVENSNGKYIAFLDDDDIWLDKKLEVQINALENSYCKISSTEGFFGNGEFDKNKNYELYNSEKFYKKIKKKYKGTGLFKNKEFPNIWDHEFIKVHNCIILSSVVVEKEVFDLYGGFNGLKNGVSDYDCWKGILQLTDLIYINQPLFYYDGDHGSGRNY